MASGITNFLYKDDFDAIIAVIDADILQNDEESNLEINSCIKNIPSKIKSSFQCTSKNNFRKLNCWIETLSIRARIAKKKVNENKLQLTPQPSAISISILKL